MHQASTQSNSSSSGRRAHNHAHPTGTTRGPNDGGRVIIARYQQKQAEVVLEGTVGGRSIADRQPACGAKSATCGCEVLGS